MTKRKDPSELKIRARDDLTEKPRVKKGANAEMETATARIEKLRATAVLMNSDLEIAAANPDRPLTEKQRLFVRHWAQGESILSASHRAGYADGGTMAYRLAKDPAILKLYREEKRLYEEAAQMSRKRVMEMLQEGFEMGKMMSEGGVMVAAAREIGKMCGYYEPVRKKIDLTVNGTITAKMERMSDEDLLKVIQDADNVVDVVMREIADETGEGEEE